MKTTTTQEILLRVKRLGFDVANSKADAIMFIGDAIASIGYHIGFQPVAKKITVANYRVRLPLDCVKLKKVYYENYELPYSSDQRLLRYSEGMIGGEELTEEANAIKLLELQKEIDRLNSILEDLESDPVNEDLLDAKADSQKKIDSMSRAMKTTAISTGDQLVNSYVEVAGYIKTSFSSGEIEVHYLGYPIEENTGYPLIRDTYKYKRAVVWYVISQLLLMGFKHPVINFEKADDRWEFYRESARNEGKFESSDKMEEFTQFWTRMNMGGQLNDEAFIII